MPTPLWKSDPTTPFRPLDRDLTVDVAVIGGGITGATTAYLLKQAGLKVALLEKRELAGGETGRTSAHVTYVTDQRLGELVETHGLESARKVWEAGRAALRQIEQLVAALKIECDYARVPGYLHAPWDTPRTAVTIAERNALQAEADLAVREGFFAAYHEAVPLVNRPGIRFADQAVLHPVKYVEGVLRHVVGGGGHVFEQSPVDEVTETGEVRCRGRRIRCGHIVFATHVPLRGTAPQALTDLLQSKLLAANTYLVAARLPLHTADPAIYWDTASPYNYLRITEGRDHLTAIFGGEDHPTGREANTFEPLRRLEDRWKEYFPTAEIEAHWSGQVLHAPDGLPLIGEFGPRQYVATGFAGNGLSYGTLAAMMIRDQIAHIADPWQELFRADRSDLGKGAWSYLKVGLNYSRYFVQDRILPRELPSIDQVPPDCGAIVRINDEPVAVYRDADDRVTCRSAVCTHMGCLVHWNQAEGTWDCPCHGSRFSTCGEVVSGPAPRPLADHAATHVP